MQYSFDMPNCARFGKKEKGLSLFQIDAGREWRGGQRQSFLLAKELKRQGYRFRFYLQPDSPLHRKCLEEELPFFLLKMRSEMDLRAIWRLARDMKRNTCMLVHCHDAHSTPLGAAAASLAKVPIRVISRRVDFPLKRNFLSTLKYRENIDLIIAISQEIKNVLVDDGIDPRCIKVIPSGIDFSPFEGSRPKNYLHREVSFSKKDYIVGIV